MNLIEDLFGLICQARDGNAPPEQLVSDELDFLLFAFRHLRVSRSQILQDLWVLYETRSKRGGYFVEFGASDGLFLSNTYLLERSFAWNGVLAEANPLYHDALRRNRHCTVSTKCVAARSGETVEFNQAPFPEVSTIARYSASDANAPAREGGNIITLETTSLLDLLGEVKAPKQIDYMSIDTEGSEIEILSAFDFDAYDIRLISVEHNYVRRDELFALLSARGYDRKFAKFSRWDDWYIKRG